MTLLFDQARNQIQSAALDLSVGNYYLHLVTVTPNITATTVNDLALAAGPGYAPTPLTGRSFTNGIWTFNNVTTGAFDNTGADVIGSVICRQAGANPATTDMPICFSLLRNDSNIAFTVDPSNERIQVKFNPTTGVIRSINTYAYNSGGYAAPFDTNGSIYQLNTQNYTQSWANTHRGYVCQNNNAYQITTLTDRTDGTGASEFQATSHVLFDFGTSGGANRLIRIGSIALGMAYTTAQTVTVLGTNFINSYNEVYNGSGITWVNLGSLNIPAHSSGNLNWINYPINDTRYWRYIKLVPQAGIQIGELEFYSSTISTTTLNLA